VLSEVKGQASCVPGMDTCNSTQTTLYNGDVDGSTADGVEERESRIGQTKESSNVQVNLAQMLNWPPSAIVVVVISLGQR